MSQTALARGQAPAVATRSNPLRQTRKRHAPGEDPIPEEPNRGGPSDLGGGGGGGDPDDDGDPDPDPDAAPNPGDGGGGGGSGNRDDLIDALTTLTHAMRPPKSRAKAKAKEPDTFDGSDPRKLAAFILQCSLYFRNFPEDYREDDSKINFALSYLKGPAIEWFEPWLIEPDDFDEDPEWSYDYSAFLSTLRTNYGNIDPIADAEEAIEALKMKETWKIIRYNTEFNRHAAKLQYPDSILKRRYYKGLAARIKDPISGMRIKPATYQEMRLAAQDFDARHWEREREKSREERKFDKPKSANSASSTTTPSSNNSRPNSNAKSTTPKSNSATTSTANTPKAATTTTPTYLGKDGKLTPAERKRRLDAGLCLFCGSSGHRVKECPKSTSSAAKGRAATVDSKSTPDSKK